jgi:AcrR family transcriptional regulator
MSEPRVDLRVRRTHKLLWDALVSLLQERDFDAISVTEVCERAMEQRTTFYKHYEDKHGLLRHGVSEELAALYRGIEAEAAPGPDGPTDHVTAILAHVKTRRRFYAVMLTGSAAGRFSSLLSATLSARMEQAIPGGGQSGNVPAGLFSRVSSAALVAMIAWWLEDGCRVAPAAMSRHLASMLEPPRRDDRPLGRSSASR